MTPEAHDALVRSGDVLTTDLGGCTPAGCFIGKTDSQGVYDSMSTDFTCFRSSGIWDTGVSHGPFDVEQSSARFPGTLAILRECREGLSADKPVKVVLNGHLATRSEESHIAGAR